MPVFFLICLEILAHRLRNDREIDKFQIGEYSHLLEIYADDMTIFLEANSRSIRTVVEILKNFYALSGLKISISKTKAVWFGKDWMSNEILCPEIELIWAKRFTLLGIQFDNNCDTMEDNFWKKMDSLKKLLSNWLYRYMTPYGKVTILRSKLSHIALVVPNPSKLMIKHLETTISQRKCAALMLSFLKILEA